MTLIISLVGILQTFSISLGVGASSLAIINFFVAIADGKIDETERRMMGVVYLVLRIAMMAILATSAILAMYEYYVMDGMLSVLSIIELVTLAVLFLNATLMTLRLMPSTFGPALQAGSWYTMGTLAALQIQGIAKFSYLVFFMGYLTWLVLAVGIVNGIMAILKAKRKPSV